MKEEFLAEITSDGEVSNKKVKRSDAHRLGIWHRAVSIFVINPLGEILIERRIENKDLFPGYYDIVGGHITAGKTPIETAISEIKEEISLDIQSNQIRHLCDDDEIIENVVLPEKNIINLERKTIFVLEITEDEENKILDEASKREKLSKEEFNQLGVFGEVSHIEFWSWERLFNTFSSQEENKLASGAISSLSNRQIREKIYKLCIERRNNCRKSFIQDYYQFINAKQELDNGLDQWLHEIFLPKTALEASNSLVMEFFSDGKNQLAGAYKMGDFRRMIGGDKYWRDKYLDPGNRYVENLIKALSFGQSEKICNEIEEQEEGIKFFVSRILELPLNNGERFRDSFGNLVDIAIARKAVLFWLEKNTKIEIKSLLDYPTGLITKSCIDAGKILYEEKNEVLSPKGDIRLFELIQFGIEASSADFNNQDFQRNIYSDISEENLPESIYRNISGQRSELKLGGIEVLKDFYHAYIDKSPQVKIAFFPGSVAQATFSFAIVNEILDQNQNASVSFIPKAEHPGNDLSFSDANILFEQLTKETLKKLIKFKEKGRFAILPNGPVSHGINPACIHEAIAQEIVCSDVIFAEGQAYAEIRGWKKPTFISFRVNGRVAKAIHGDSLAGKGGFIKLIPGIDHYQAILNKKIYQNDKISLVSQTTVEYVQAILCENFNFIINDIFKGNVNKAIEQIHIEARNLKKTFSQIILGTTNIEPDENEINKFKSREFPVFACGGGGGFSAVTIKALKLLGIPTVAGVPSTDDGGSTGKLQKQLKYPHGFVFGVGDMANILQESMNNGGKRAILSYRFPDEPETVVEGIRKRIIEELETSASGLGSANDFLSFICDQLNFARIIDERIQNNEDYKITIKGASIRNLNIIAAYKLYDALGDNPRINDEKRIRSLIVLEKALGISPNLIALPVTYDECILFLDYEKEIPQAKLKNNHINDTSYDKYNNRILGQQYIDKLLHEGKRKKVGVIGHRGRSEPRANEEYLRRIREAKLFIMGAGSLISSQLSQLVIPGVIDELLKAESQRRILILNHVKMDETYGMTVTDHIKLIEEVAEQMCSAGIKDKIFIENRKICISDIFSDIVIPRTIARELEEEMEKLKYTWEKPTKEKFNADELYRNKYIDFLEKYSLIREKYEITDKELEILSFLEQPPELYKERREKGRYRGAVYATEKDIEYLIGQGIQVRNIHQVDSVGSNVKVIKKEGAIEIEYFPGLLPEALMGIFKIVLERN